MIRDRPTIVVLGVVLLVVFGASAATLDTTVTSTSGADGGASTGAGAPTETDRTGDPLNVSGGIFPQDDMWLEDFNDSDAEERTGAGDGSDGGDGGSDPVTPQLPTSGLVLVAAVFLAVTALVVRRFRSGKADGTKGADDDSGRRDALTDVGATAGDAADELAQGATPENVVYRTWVEMTRQLDVTRPATRTPGEFADEAVDAGMQPGDVRTLTDVFEQVRYGDEPVTEERRRRAVEALRHIEETYGTEGGNE